jgi:hypothetical protein
MVLYQILQKNSEHGFYIQYKSNLQQCSVCDPAKILLVSKFSYLLLSNPTHETKTGIANRWKTTQPIIMMGESETGSSSQIIIITLFSGRCLSISTNTQCVTLHRKSWMWFISESSGTLEKPQISEPWTSPGTV